MIENKKIGLKAAESNEEALLLKMQKKLEDERVRGRINRELNGVISEWVEHQLKKWKK